jgi:hypothetical protein
MKYTITLVEKNDQRICIVVDRLGKRGIGNYAAVIFFDVLKINYSHPTPLNTGISGDSVLNSVRDDFTVKSLRTFMENRADMQAKIYKPARLSAPKKGDWMIVWYNYNPDSQKLERVRKTFNLNRIPDLQQRRTLGNTLVVGINKALHWALSEHIKTLSTQSSQAVYAGTANRFIRWLQKNKLHHKPINGFGHNMRRWLHCSHGAAGSVCSCSYARLKTPRLEVPLSSRRRASCSIKMKYRRIFLPTSLRSTIASSLAISMVSR